MQSRSSVQIYQDSGGGGFRMRSSITYKLLIGFLSLTTLTTIGLGISTGVLSYQNGAIKERFKDQSLSLKICQSNCQKCECPGGGGDQPEPTPIPNVKCSNMYKISYDPQIGGVDPIQKIIRFGIANYTSTDLGIPKEQLPIIEEVCTDPDDVCEYEEEVDNTIIVNSIGQLSITGEEQWGMKFQVSNSENVVQPPFAIQTSSILGNIDLYGNIDGAISTTGSVESISVGSITGLEGVGISVSGDVSAPVVIGGALNSLQVSGSVGYDADTTAISVGSVTGDVDFLGGITGDVQLKDGLEGNIVSTVIDGAISTTGSVGSISVGSVSGIDGAGISVTNNVNAPIEINGSVGYNADETAIKVGSVIGNVVSSGSIDGSITLDGSNSEITGAISTTGAVGSISVGGGVGQDLSKTAIQVGGTIIGSVNFLKDTIGDVQLKDGLTGNIVSSGSIDGSITTSGSIGSVSAGSITGTGEVAAIYVDGPITGAIQTTGSVGSISVESITGIDGAGISVTNNVEGLLTIGGNVGTEQSETAIQVGSVNGNIQVLGSINGDITLNAPNAAITGAISTTGSIGSVSASSITGAITTSGSVGSVSASSITGAITTSGSVGSVSAGSITGIGEVGITITNNVNAPVVIGGALNSLQVSGSVGYSSEETAIKVGSVIGDIIVTSGSIDGDITLNEANAAITGAITTQGSISSVSAGSITGIEGITVNGNINGPVNVKGDVNGPVNVNGDVNGSVTLSGKVEGDVKIEEVITGSLTTNGVSNGLTINDDIQGNITVGRITGSLTTDYIEGGITIKGYTLENGSTIATSGPISITGDVNHPISITGDVSEPLIIDGSLDQLQVSGSVGSDESETAIQVGSIIGNFELGSGISTTSAQEDSDIIPKQAGNPVIKGSLNINGDIQCPKGACVNIKGDISATNGGGVYVKGDITPSSGNVGVQVDASVKGDVQVGGSIETLTAKSVSAVKITYDTPQTTEDIINVIGSIELYEQENNESATLTIGAITNEPSIASLNVGDVSVTGIQNKAITDVIISNVETVNPEQTLISSIYFTKSDVVEPPLYIGAINSALDIETINAGSVGTVKITYDAPQNVEDITDVVGSIALYEQEDNTTATLTIGAITNEPSISGLMNGNVQITKITNDSIDKILVSNVQHTQQEEESTVIGQIQFFPPSETVTPSLSIEQINDTFDIGKVKTPGNISTLDVGKIENTTSDNMILNPPPKSLTLVFGETSTMDSITIQDTNKVDKLSITTINSSFGINSFITSSVINTVDISNVVDNMEVKQVEETLTITDKVGNLTLMGDVANITAQGTITNITVEGTGSLANVSLVGSATIGTVNIEVPVTPLVDAPAVISSISLYPSGSTYDNSQLNIEGVYNNNTISKINAQGISTVSAHDISSVSAQNEIGTVSSSNNIQTITSAQISGDITVSDGIQGSITANSIGSADAPTSTVLTITTGITGSVSLGNVVCGSSDTNSITDNCVQIGNVEAYISNSEKSAISIGSIQANGENVNAINVGGSVNGNIYVEDSIKSLAAKSIEAIKITYDTPISNEEATATNVIGSIELYEENIETAKLTIGPITNEPSITSITVGDVYINNTKSDFVSDIIISNVENTQSPEQVVINSIQLKEPNAEQAALYIGEINSSFDIDTIRTPKTISVLDAGTIENASSTSMILDPPPKSLTLIFDETSTMDSVRIQDKSNITKLSVTTIDSSFNINSISTSSNIGTITLTGSVSNLTANSVTELTATSVSELTATSIGSADASTSTALKVTTGITGSVSLGNVACGDETNKITSACVSAGNIVSYSTPDTNGPLPSLKVVDITSYGGYGVAMNKISGDGNGIAINSVEVGGNGVTIGQAINTNDYAINVKGTITCGNSSTSKLANNCIQIGNVEAYMNTNVEPGTEAQPPSVINIGNIKAVNSQALNVSNINCGEKLASNITDNCVQIGDVVAYIDSENVEVQPAIIINDIEANNGDAILINGVTADYAGVTISNNVNVKYGSGIKAANINVNNGEALNVNDIACGTLTSSTTDNCVSVGNVIANISDSSKSAISIGSASSYEEGKTIVVSGTLINKAGGSAIEVNGGNETTPSIVGNIKVSNDIQGSVSLEDIVTTTYALSVNDITCGSEINKLDNNCVSMNDVSNYGKTDTSAIYVNSINSNDNSSGIYVQTNVVTQNSGYGVYIKGDLTGYGGINVDGSITTTGTSAIKLNSDIECGSIGSPIESNCVSMGDITNYGAENTNTIYINSVSSKNLNNNGIYVVGNVESHANGVYVGGVISTYEDAVQIKGSVTATNSDAITINGLVESKNGNGITVGQSILSSASAVYINGSITSSSDSAIFVKNSVIGDNNGINIGGDLTTTSGTAINIGGDLTTTSGTAINVGVIACGDENNTISSNCVSIGDVVANISTDSGVLSAINIGDITTTNGSAILINDVTADYTGIEITYGVSVEEGPGIKVSTINVANSTGQNAISVTESISSQSTNYATVNIAGGIMSNNGQALNTGTIACGNSTSLIKANCVQMNDINAYLNLDESENLVAAIKLNDITAANLGNGIQVNSIQAQNSAINVSSTLTSDDDNVITVKTNIIANGAGNDAISVLGNITLNEGRGLYVDGTIQGSVSQNVIYVKGGSETQYGVTGGITITNGVNGQVDLGKGVNGQVDLGNVANGQVSLGNVACGSAESPITSNCISIGDVVANMDAEQAEVIPAITIGNVTANDGNAILINNITADHAGIVVSDSVNVEQGPGIEVTKVKVNSQSGYSAIHVNKSIGSNATTYAAVNIETGIVSNKGQAIDIGVIGCGSVESVISQNCISINDITHYGAENTNATYINAINSNNNAISIGTNVKSSNGTAINVDGKVIGGTNGYGVYVEKDLTGTSGIYVQDVKTSGPGFVVRNIESTDSSVPAIRISGNLTSQNTQKEGALLIGGNISAAGRAISIGGYKGENSNIFTKAGEALYVSGNIEANSDVFATYPDVIYIEGSIKHLSTSSGEVIHVGGDITTNSNSGQGVYVEGSISTSYSCLRVKGSMTATGAYAVTVDNDLTGTGGLLVSGSVTATSMNGIYVKEGITSSSDAVNIFGSITAGGKGVYVGGNLRASNGDGVFVVGDINATGGNGVKVSNINATSGDGINVNGAINATNANAIIITGDVNATSTSDSPTELYGFKANNVTYYNPDSVYEGTGAAISVNNVKASTGTAINATGYVRSVTGQAIGISGYVQADDKAIEINGTISSNANTAITVNSDVSSLRGDGIYVSGNITATGDISNSIYANGVYVGGNIIATGDISNRIIYTNGVYVGGNISSDTGNGVYVGGNISAYGGGIAISNNVTSINADAIYIGGNISVNGSARGMVVGRSINTTNGAGIKVLNDINSPNVDCIVIVGNLISSSANGITVSQDIQAGYSGIQVSGNITASGDVGISVMGGITTSNADSISIGGNISSTNGNGISIGGNISSTNGNGISIGGNVSASEVSGTPGLINAIYISGNVSASDVGIYVGRSINTTDGSGIVVMSDINSAKMDCIYIMGNLISSSAKGITVSQNIQAKSGISVGGNLRASNGAGVNVGGNINTTGGNGITVGGAINVTMGDGINVVGDVNVTSTSNDTIQLYGFKANNVTCYYDTFITQGTGAAIYVNNVSTTAGTAIIAMGKVLANTGQAVDFRRDVWGGNKALEIGGYIEAEVGTAIQVNGDVISDYNGEGISVAGNVSAYGGAISISNNVTSNQADAIYVGGNITVNSTSNGIFVGRSITTTNGNAINVQKDVITNNRTAITINGNVSSANGTGISVNGNVSGSSNYGTTYAMYINGNITGKSAAGGIYVGRSVSAGSNTILLNGGVKSNNGNGIIVNGDINTATDSIRVTGSIVSGMGNAVTLEGSITADGNGVSVEGAITSSSGTAVKLSDTIKTMFGTAIYIAGDIISQNDGYGIEFKNVDITANANGKYSLYAHGGVWSSGLLIKDSSGSIDLLTITSVNMNTKEFGNIMITGASGNKCIVSNINIQYTTITGEYYTMNTDVIGGGLISVNNNGETKYLSFNEQS